MVRLKCKNSVFCILFLFYFFLGTICGIFLFRKLQGAHCAWITAYCTALTQMNPPDLLKQLFFICKPLAIALVLGICPSGYRLIPILIAVRGCIMAYIAAFYAVSGLPPAALVFRWLLFLPVFYYLCWLAYSTEGAFRHSDGHRSCTA